MKDSTHLRLEGIREAIEDLSGPELAAEVMRLEFWSEAKPPMSEKEDAPAAVEAAGSPGESATDFMTRILETTREPEQADPPGEEAVRRSMPLMGLSRLTMYNKIMRRRSKTPPAEADTEEANTWTRIRITNDLEIHFRPSAGRRFQKKLVKLVATARKSFGK